MSAHVRTCETSSVKAEVKRENLWKPLGEARSEASLLASPSWFHMSSREHLCELTWQVHVTMISELALVVCKHLQDFTISVISMKSVKSPEISDFNEIKWFRNLIHDVLKCRTPQRRTMKHERNHQGAVDKSFSEQQIGIVDANYILCEKNWIRTHSGTRCYVRQMADEIQVNLELLKITIHQNIRLFASFNQGTASLQQ